MSFTKPKVRLPFVLGACALLVVLILAYLWRPLGIIRGPFMAFYTHPATFFGPLLAVVVVGGLHVAIKTATGKKGYRPRSMGSIRWYLVAGSPALSALVMGVVVLSATATFSSAWTQRAIARNTTYAPLDVRRLQGGEVRVKPYEVVRNQLANSFNSPTEQVTNVHVVNVAGRLNWTAVRDPKGLFRRLTKPTTGIITSDAQSSGPGVKVGGPGQDAQFTFGPGMQISQNIKWQLAKRCYTCSAQEMVALATPRGPVVMVPYVRYEGGLWVKRPVFGGVFLVHPDGRIDDLNPSQAAANAMVRQSGRMFPEALARRTALSYKYIHGTLNRMFTHRDGYEVADTAGNNQPYLQKFANLPNPQWVTTLKPRGATFSTGMVMLTDAVSGQTRVWKVPQGISYIGNEKALDIVRGERLGVNFAGAFRAVEPRQVFPDGRLHFLVSVVPAQATRVTVNVIVDAERQAVTKVFPATEQGDRDLIAYLNDKPVSGSYEFTGSDPGDPSAIDGDVAEPAPRAPGQTPDGAVPGPLPTGDDAVSTIERLLERNRSQQRGLESQERDLRRILRAVQDEGTVEEAGK